VSSFLPRAVAPPDRELASAVGQTPLVRLRRLEPHDGVEIYAKLESRNPGGSVKDRAALAMILEGERTGALRPGRILLDATSGNTGIAYAMLAAARGYRVQLCVPANVTAERRRLLVAYGAELILTDPMEGSDGAIVEARRLHARDPDVYCYPDQYSNPANWGAHYDGTGPEILRQTDGRLTHFVAGLGTSGTFVGTGRRLREALPAVRLISVEPDSPLHGLEGLKRMASAIVPAIYDRTIADEAIEVSTEESWGLTRRLAREEGLMVGPSSGAALAGCLRVSRALERAVVVTVFPDGGDRYLSEPHWTDGLRLDDTLAADIRAHAERAYPDECCGALLGRAPDRVEALLPVDNASDGARRRFLIGPDDYRRAEMRAIETGRDLLGFYHSHPDHPAVPSAFDRDHAWPNFSYVIVPVAAGAAGAPRSWRLRPDRIGFTEETVTTSRGR
jgi:cysteine synthase B